MRPLRPRSTALRHALSALATLLLGAWVAGCGVPGHVVQSDPTGDRQAELAQVRAHERQDPDQVYWPYREAELLVAADSLGAAEKALERALDLDPDHPASLSLISKLDYDAGRHQRAIERLTAAAAHGPLPTELQLALGLHYEAAGNFDASDSLFRQVHSHHSSVAYYALRSDDLERAERVAAEAVQDSPESAAAHNDYGITRLYAGHPQEARQEFLRALELDSHHLGALYNLALVESHYLLDDAKGREWYQRYRSEGGTDDPDSLASYFEGGGERQVRR
jgi:tetratricopeptide (TPR) repeat protein